jgi:hypothetical protein
MHCVYPLLSYDDCTCVKSKVFETVTGIWKTTHACGHATGKTLVIIIIIIITGFFYVAKIARS